MRNSERCGLERRWRLSYSIQYSTVACVDTIRKVPYSRMVQEDGEGSPYPDDRSTGNLGSWQSRGTKGEKRVPCRLLDIIDDIDADVRLSRWENEVMAETRKKKAFD